MEGLKFLFKTTQGRLLLLLSLIIDASVIYLLFKLMR